MPYSIRMYAVMKKKSRKYWFSNDNKTERRLNMSELCQEATTPKIR
jgi:hypothetical protein